MMKQKRPSFPRWNPNSNIGNEAPSCGPSQGWDQEQRYQIERGRSSPQVLNRSPWPADAWIVAASWVGPRRGTAQPAKHRISSGTGTVCSKGNAVWESSLAWEIVCWWLGKWRELWSLRMLNQSKTQVVYFIFSNIIPICRSACP